MIYVVATIEVVPGRRTEFLQLFRELVPEVLAETGCIEYAPAVDTYSGLSGQGAERDDVVVVVEKWETIDALRAHQAAPHMETFRERATELIQNVSLQVLAPA